MVLYTYTHNLCHMYRIVCHCTSASSSNPNASYEWHSHSCHTPPLSPPYLHQDTTYSKNTQMSALASFPCFILWVHFIMDNRCKSVWLQCFMYKCVCMCTAANMYHLRSSRSPGFTLRGSPMEVPPKAKIIACVNYVTSIKIGVKEKEEEEEEKAYTH